MEYQHRILIGMTGGIGRSTESFQQENTNKIAFYVGKQIGLEMLERDLITQKMSVEEILKICNSEINFADSCSIQTGDKVKISLSGCNICPKKVGKYTIKETACPMPGIMRGLLSAAMKDSAGIFPKLNPGEICHIEFDNIG